MSETTVQERVRAVVDAAVRDVNVSRATQLAVREAIVRDLAAATAGAQTDRKNTSS